MRSILYCRKCKEYTMDEICSRCKEKTISKNPPRFSIQDHYGEYRRKLKKLERVVENGRHNCKVRIKKTKA